MSHPFKNRVSSVQLVQPEPISAFPASTSATGSSSSLGTRAPAHAFSEKPALIQRRSTVIMHDTDVYVHVALRFARFLSRLLLVVAATRSFRFSLRNNHLRHLSLQ
jgi:hypothetical protein